MQIFGQSRAKAASASRWNPGFCAIRTLTCAALGFRSLLPPYHHEPLCSRSPLTSKFLVRILGESHPVSFRAEKQGNCPQSGGFGQSESALAEYGKSSTWGAVATGVLGKPAIALCAVPLLIPVSSLICAHERPRCLRNTILSASTSACSAELSLELCITIRLYLDRMMG